MSDSIDKLESILSNHRIEKESRIDGILNAVLSKDMPPKPKAPKLPEIEEYEGPDPDLAYESERDSRMNTGEPGDYR